MAPGAGHAVRRAGLDVPGEVLAPDLAAGVAVLGGEQAGPVEVEERRKGALGEGRPRAVGVDIGGEAAGGCGRAEPPAYHVGVLALDEGVVVGGAGAGLCEPLLHFMMRRRAALDAIPEPTAGSDPPTPKNPSQRRAR